MYFFSGSSLEYHSVSWQLFRVLWYCFLATALGFIYRFFPDNCLGVPGICFLTAVWGFQASVSWQLSGGSRHLFPDSCLEVPCICFLTAFLSFQVFFFLAVVSWQMYGVPFFCFSGSCLGFYIFLYFLAAVRVSIFSFSWQLSGVPSVLCLN